MNKGSGSGTTWTGLWIEYVSYIDYVLGDLNGWTEDRVRVGITGAFGVSGENYNGRRKMEFSAEKGLCD